MTRPDLFLRMLSRALPHPLPRVTPRAFPTALPRNLPRRAGQVAWQAVGVLAAVLAVGMLAGFALKELVDTRRPPRPAPPFDQQMNGPLPPDARPGDPPRGALRVGPPDGAPGDPRGAPDGAPGRGPGRLPMQLERLVLTDAQHRQIKDILDAQKPHVDSLMAEIMPRLRARSDSTMAAIRAILTAEQRQRFDADMPKDAMAPGLPGAGGRGGRRGGPPPPPQ